MRLCQFQPIAEYSVSLYQTLFSDRINYPAQLLLSHLHSELECVFSRLANHDRLHSRRSINSNHSTQTSPPIYHPLINKLKVEELEVLFGLNMSLVAQTAIRLNGDDSTNSVHSTLLLILNQYPPVNHLTLQSRPQLQFSVITCLYQLFIWYFCC